MNISTLSHDVIDENKESPTYGQPVKKDYLLIELCDTGLGIDPEFIEHIWESFSKGDTSLTRKQDGTGLGLSICKNLVAINGGEIKVESKLRQGSKFWLKWNIELIENLSKYQEKFHFLPDFIRSKRILVIHPVENARNSIINHLKSIENVDVFDTFDKAVQKAKDYVELHKKFAYDLIFIGLYEKNEEEVVNAVSELRKIELNCNNSLTSLVVFIVFPSDRGRALVEKLIKNVEGRCEIIYTPITWRKLIGQFSNIDNDLNGNGKNSCAKIFNRIDNDSINLRTIMQQLSELGYSTISATSVQDAINIIKTEFGSLNDIYSKSRKISMILIDYNLSTMAGFDVSKAIRSVSKIPIVAVTDLFTEEIRNKCVNCGLNDCLLKPLKAEQLENILTKYVVED
ncbi:32671_t:CDS:2 [Racocetra persica]|uniref:32671_t:CDS:1 n=1 Tax=Racocetra persica TaxID=160502 RepID=A0ACA9Q5C2_9GLOM|nr:32671_t:CDS:2 [Racocetra persica]